MNQNFLRKFLFLVTSIVAIAGFLGASVAFADTPTVTSAKITGPSTVTIVYSEPVNTSLNDYSNFTGALANASLSGVSGSGTSVITLTFAGNGTTFGPSATGGLTIASTVTSISTDSGLGSGPYTVNDGQAPLLQSFGLTSSLTNNAVASAGDTLNVTFTTNESIYTNPTVTIDGNSVQASGNGAGPYTAAYTLSSSDTPNTVPVNIQFTDLAGNQGTGSFTLGGGIGPKIISITSNANTSGQLGVNSTIVFTVTLANPVPGALVTGAYDGIPLSWTTSNGGATYNATYTVQSGNTSTYSPVQITGVTVRDPSGNVSTPASGSDVMKTINAQSFAITETTPVPSTVTVNNPQYTFYSSQEGTITFGGDCSSLNESAAVGENYITFNPLPNGTHSNCTVTVVDSGGYSSNTLSLTPFTVEVSGNTAVANTTSSYPAGCSSSSGYSSTTGQSCAITTVTYPIGCTSAVGYSSTTGQSCSETTTTPVTTTTSTTPAYLFYNPLSYGSSDAISGNADVTQLQMRLTKEGVYSGPVTGYYGSLTEAAVEEYQGLHGINQLGNVGPATRAMLNSGV